MPRYNTELSWSDHRSPVKNLFRMIGWTLTILILLAITVWETLAVYYSNLPEGLRLPGAIVIALVLSRYTPGGSPSRQINPVFFVRIFNYPSLVPVHPAF